MTTTKSSWIETLIVALDGVGRVSRTLAVARSVARGISAPLQILYRTDPAVPLEAVPAAHHLSADDLAGAILKGVIGGTPEEVLREIGGLPAPLLVTGLRHTPGPRLDALAQAALARSQFPILLVPDGQTGPEWRPREILVPYDGSPTAASSLEPIGDLARWARATLAVLHVSRIEKSGPEAPGTLRVPQFIDYPQHDWPEWTREFLDRLRSQGAVPPDIEMSLRVAVGTPGDEILSWAREHTTDLVAMSWHGDLGPGRADTFKTVIENIATPLLCLPAMNRQPRES